MVVGIVLCHPFHFIGVERHSEPQDNQRRDRNVKIPYRQFVVIHDSASRRNDAEILNNLSIHRLISSNDNFASDAGWNFAHWRFLETERVPYGGPESHKCDDR